MAHENSDFTDIVVVCICSNAPLSINSKIPSYDILPTAQIYIDKTRSLTFQDIQTKEKEFFSNDKKLHHLYIKLSIQ